MLISCEGTTCLAGRRILGKRRYEYMPHLREFERRKPRREERPSPEWETVSTPLVLREWERELAGTLTGSSWPTS